MAQFNKDRKPLGFLVSHSFVSATCTFFIIEESYQENRRLKSFEEFRVFGFE